ncbi:MAG: hypothetical protein PUP93_33505 [Rhizonema sp. NSF051]|nr:hypothetical protein [Rhizonema sp. NSF051]
MENYVGDRSQEQARLWQQNYVDCLKTYQSLSCCAKAETDNSTNRLMN